MWTSKDVAEIQQNALSIKHDVKLYAIPFGLQVEKGPDAIVEHLLERIPNCCSSESRWALESWGSIENVGGATNYMS